MAKQTEKFDYMAFRKAQSEGEPHRLYLLWGAEDYLIRDFVKLLRSKCVSPGSEDFDAKRIDSPTPDAADVEEALNAMPFFGGRTFLELHGFDVNRCKDERLMAALADIPEWCTVVIILPNDTQPDNRLSFVKQLKKDGTAAEFTSQSSAMLYQWLQQRFRERGKTIGRDAMDRLMFLSGELMNRLLPEIDKVASYAAGERVTVEDVNAVAHHIPEADAFEMTDRIAKGDTDGAAHILAELLAGGNAPDALMGAINWQVRQLYAARVCMDAGQSGAVLKELIGTNSDYRVKMLMNSARGFSSRELTADVRLCCEAVMNLRGSLMSSEDAMKEFLVRMAMERRNA